MLTDDALEQLAAGFAAAPSETIAMATELRARRAADLSAEDVEALKFARRLMTCEWFQHSMHVPEIREHVESCERANRVLDKLIGGRDA